MNDRLVTTCKHILNVLPAEGWRVNKIISQTSLGPKGSPDRTHAEHAIGTLEEGKLVFYGPWSPGKPKITKLTTLGNEIKDLMNQIKLYRESYDKFEKKIKDQMVDEEAENSEWMERSNKMSVNLQNGRMFVESLFKKNILLALAHRYSFIYYKYEINEIANEILVRIISDEFTYQLLENDNPNSAKMNKFDKLLELFLGQLILPTVIDIKRIYTSDFYISSWRFGKEELKDTLIKLLSIAKISSELALEAMTFVDYSDPEKLKMILNEKTESSDDQSYPEYVGGVLQSFNPHGYKNLPDSEEYRKKDKQELNNIFKKFI